MKIISESEEEFDELVRTFKYLHDFYCDCPNPKLNWKFWTWHWYGSIWKHAGYSCLDLDEYPLLNSIIHLYRVKTDINLEPSSKEEVEYIKEMFYVNSKDYSDVKNILQEEITEFPLFVKISGSDNCLRYIKDLNIYRRDAGSWEVAAIWVNDKLVTKSYINSINDLILEKCSYEEWKKSNRGYIPSTMQSQESV